MSLEDIPEMQIFRGTDCSDLLVDYLTNRENSEYRAKFVVVKLPNEKEVIFSSESPAHLGCFYDFIKLVRERNEVQLDKDKSYILGGGMLEVSEEKIKLHGDSQTYGKFDEQVVRPIVERYIERNLPGRQLVID